MKLTARKASILKQDQNMQKVERKNACFNQTIQNMCKLFFVNPFFKQ